MKEFIFDILPLKETIGRLMVSSFLDHPFFVIGCGRSGTTALGRALNEHPEILFSSNEAPLGYHVAELGFEYSCGATSKWYQTQIAYSSVQVRKNLRRLLYESVWGEYYGLRRNLGVFKGSLVRLKPARFWGTKAWPTENGARGMEWLFPNARFIYIVRNGIDVVTSMSKFSGFAEWLSFEKRCEYWMQSVERFDFLRGREGTLNIRFEDFLSSPYEVLKKCQIHIGTKLDDGPTRFATSTIVHPQDQPTQQGIPSKIFKDRDPGYLQWSQEERNIFKAICTRGMERLEYTQPF